RFAEVLKVAEHIEAQGHKLSPHDTARKTMALFRLGKADAARACHRLYRERATPKQAKITAKLERLLAPLYQ
ncbi:MAG: hypothetical protein AAF330_02190, partial [Pseudomonadota bacterium]